MKKTFTTIIFLLTLFLGYSSKAVAADIGLSINPPLVKAVIRPGKTITQIFTIENLSDSPKILVARLVPFTTADDLGNPHVDPRENAPWLGYFSLANSQISLDQPFELKPNQKTQLILSISVPATAPLRDLYATLLLTSYLNSTDSDLIGSSVSASIGSNLLLSISTQAAPPTILKITDFLPERGKYLRIGDYFFLDSITPLYFTALARNEGEFTAETKGIFKIERDETHPLHLQSVLPQYVLAKSSRRLGTLNGSQFHFTPSFNQIGRYTVRLDIRSENSNASTKIDVIFFPGKVFLGLIAALVFLQIIVKISTTPKENR